MNLNRGACAVCNGTGVVWALFTGASDEAVPCAACRVPTGYRTSPPAEESLLDARERELRHMASELATYKNALRDAVERLKGLHKLAVHPMKSRDAGLVIDAQRVEDECGDALEAIGILTARYETDAKGPLLPARET